MYQLIASDTAKKLLIELISNMQIGQLCQVDFDRDTFFSDEIVVGESMPNQIFKLNLTWMVSGTDNKTTDTFNQLEKIMKTPIEIQQNKRKLIL